MEIKNIYNNWRRRVLSYRVRKKLDLSDVSIISMNCIGGIMYHDCKQRFLSPTVNLYFNPTDFFKFVNDLEYYLSQTPVIEMGEKFPIGYIDDITIFFMHYSSCEEALNKWEDRKKRINYNKIFVLVVEQNGFTDEDFESFKKIKYNKLMFAKSKKYQCDDSVVFNKYAHLGELPDIIPGRYFYSRNTVVSKIKKIGE